MKNSLGHPARGEAFYPRDSEINRIYRVLDSNTSIYLSAPRRVGKTSILKYIEEYPRTDYYFVYIITESVESQNEFFKVVFEKLVESDAIKAMSKVFNTIKEAATNILGRVKKVYNLEIREAGETDYYEILIELFASIKPEYGHVVIMVDEFPQTIQNIINVSGGAAAERFIQKNREMRHHHHVIDKISFLYTGSQSLYPMVEKVTSLTAVNDLRTVEVQPLARPQAIDFMQKLLKSDGLVLREEILEYVLQRIGWLIPFHLQLIEQELIDVYESNSIEIDQSAVDKAFDQVIHTRNKPQFEPYFARLKTLFKFQEYEFVMELLKFIATNETIDADSLHDLSTKFEIEAMRQIMDILEGDGYLFKSSVGYIYTSPILRLWCQKHICN